MTEPLGDAYDVRGTGPYCCSCPAAPDTPWGSVR